MSLGVRAASPHEPASAALTGTVPGEPVTVTVARRVAPGKGAEFENWLGGILGAAEQFPGFLGGGALRPGRLGDDWHVVYRFASPAQLARWESSPERADWLTRGQALIDDTSVQRVSGLETWFSLPGRTAPAPPRWKMALVSLIAIVPLVLLMNVLLLPHFAHWPLVARTLLFSGMLTALMTWVIMPRATYLFRRFLYGPWR